MHNMGDTSFSIYMDGLYGYAVALTRDRTIAADLVQETYVRALKAKDSLREDRNIKSWLFTITRNIWLNELRQRKTSPRIIDLEGDQNIAEVAIENAKDPYEVYVSKVEREQVREAIQQLPVEFREIIILREYEELSYQEIAKLLDCPPGTVMSRLARARTKLRALLSSSWKQFQDEERLKATKA
jgi:RNA polymerase sigma-70 factor, ECF subfamily